MLGKPIFQLSDAGDVIGYQDINDVGAGNTYHGMALFPDGVICLSRHDRRCYQYAKLLILQPGKHFQYFLYTDGFAFAGPDTGIIALGFHEKAQVHRIGVHAQTTFKAPSD